LSEFFQAANEVIRDLLNINPKTTTLNLSPSVKFLKTEIRQNKTKKYLSDRFIFSIFVIIVFIIASISSNIIGFDNFILKDWLNIQQNQN
jgi:hypothetical protein